MTLRKKIAETRKEIFKLGNSVEQDGNKLLPLSKQMHAENPNNEHYDKLKTLKTKLSEVANTYTKQEQILSNL